jgi:hypothetical protein
MTELYCQIVFAGNALRRVFESVVAKCIAAGLVGGEGFSIDASLIKADVDKKKRTPGDQPIIWLKADEASRAEYLTALDAFGLRLTRTPYLSTQQKAIAVTGDETLSAGGKVGA